MSSSTNHMARKITLFKIATHVPNPSTRRSTPCRSTAQLFAVIAGSVRLNSLIKSQSRLKNIATPPTVVGTDVHIRRRRPSNNSVPSPSFSPSSSSVSLPLASSFHPFSFSLPLSLSLTSLLLLLFSIFPPLSLSLYFLFLLFRFYLRFY
ncbi:hypothetical protein K443DRAFT_547159 [Laccaria amethystina LaAM-08-1]|uniref:Uncharacterized protein n=1 Tax=Laccaria amethystina LaAM-08-1 TaxID=1095629 RepID=A0A0C9Y123_9AGAR|nr:hypothetical protein K443DRAFT_547159 [Laccaria amethystina LaAM-08-1]